MGKKLIVLTVSFVAACAGFLACKERSDSGLSGAASPRDGVQITIVGLNDLHGGGVTVNSKFSVGREGDRRPVKIGGPAAIKAYMEAVVAQNPKGTIILDAGDSYQGSLVSNNTRGKAVAGLFNYIGIAASSVGNHEFDWGGILSTTEANQPAYDSPFLRIVDQANYRFLAHNMRFRGQPLETVTDLKNPQGKPYRLKLDNGTPKMGSYAIFERAGVRIGVIGGITRTAMDNSSQANYREVTIRPIGEGLAKLAREVREKGAEVVVLLVHAGYSCSFASFNYENDKANTASQCPEVAAGTDEIREVFKVLQDDGQRPAEVIDVVVAGHVHAPQAHYYDDVPVIQNADKGLGFGRVDIWYDQVNRKVTAKKIFAPTLFCHNHFKNFAGCDPKAPGSNLPYPESMGAETAPVYAGEPVSFNRYERSASAAMAPYSDELEMVDRPITTLEAALENDRFKESRMARCYVDAIRLAGEADVVIAISGGIRDSLPKGQVTAGHIFEVAPFDGEAVEVSMSGRELEAYVKMQNKDFNHKSMPIISEGFKLKVACSTAGEPVTPQAIFEQGADGSWSALDQDRIYKVIVSGYLFENAFFDPFRQGRSRLLKSDRDLLTAGFSRPDRPKSCTALPQEIAKCDDSHEDSRWCGLRKECPAGGQ